MITTRKANQHDVETIAELLSAFYNFSDIEEARSVVRREYSLHYHFRIAEDDGHPIGVLTWRAHGLPKHGIIKLKRVAIDREIPDRQATFELLFDATIADADYLYHQEHAYLRKVYAVTPADNLFLSSFFEEKGMVQEAVLKNHYYDGRDEVMYSLFLHDTGSQPLVHAPAAA